MMTNKTAILQFAETLKRRINFNCSPVVVYEIIDQTAKEFLQSGAVDNQNQE